MLSKIQAAKYATHHGVETLIGNGNEKDIIISALGKNFPGTKFIAKNDNKYHNHRFWHDG